MKIILTFLFATIYFSSFSQTPANGIYKSDRWLNIKDQGLQYATYHPTMDSVKIEKTDTDIKVTFGTTIHDYSIVSVDHFINYNVLLDGVSYRIGMVPVMGGSRWTISCEGVWMVLNTTFKK